MKEVGNVTLIIIKFSELLLWISPSNINGLRSNILNTRKSVSFDFRSLVNTTYSFVLVILLCPYFFNYLWCVNIEALEGSWYKSPDSKY